MINQHDSETNDPAKCVHVRFFEVYIYPLYNIILSDVSLITPSSMNSLSVTACLNSESVFACGDVYMHNLCMYVETTRPLMREGACLWPCLGDCTQSGSNCD